MIKYDIGLGKTCISYGIAKVETETTPDGFIIKENIPAITIERLLNPKSVGEEVDSTVDVLDGVVLVIHNLEGLEVLEKQIANVRKEVEKRQAEQDKIDELIRGYNERYKEKCKKMCPYTNKYCNNWNCSSCEVEERERKWMEDIDND